ncbi:methyltransferase domain-containing protein [Bradyrhizobium yuanmingense]|uniref:methyltransferase domain-containing protein n=1 Tax=Bradyrhizobium yuanmingense TaxID=108015 RepID=UPI0023B9C118|nr:methyltransferase domain-containing protein [Bradyrhizobium yuanmingense]MDF0494650.1 methyltransferase domain-containing protein [Bradyrhizobium yuanmingense]
MSLEAARAIQIDDMQGCAGAAQDSAAQNYYTRSRREIRPLLPVRASRILEVGPGAGFTLAWLKSIYPAATTFGVELNQELEAELKEHADVAMIGDIDALISRVGSKFDLILLLDILEHVPDPTRTLQAITRSLLMDGGRVLVSVPNIAHLSVTLPLVFQRRFEYADSGILDRTHLKFFVERTAVRLLNDSGLVVKDGLITGMEGPRSKMLDRLTFGGLTHHLAKQYIMAGELITGSTAQPKINWKKNRLIS